MIKIKVKKDNACYLLEVEKCPHSDCLEIIIHTTDDGFTKWNPNQSRSIKIYISPESLLDCPEEVIKEILDEYTKLKELEEKVKLIEGKVYEFN